MPAAKHELPKNHGQEALIADAPGIGLSDPPTGSICWQVLLGDKQTMIMRRDLADKFFGIFGWHEDIETAMLLAKEAKARRKRLRREARRYAGNTPHQAEHLDQFFRTDKEVTRDEQPVKFTRKQVQDRQGHRRRRRLKKHRAKANGVKRESPPPDRNLPDQQAPREPLPYFVKEARPERLKNEPPRVAKRRYPQK
jgi:hypothetical protein